MRSRAAVAAGSALLASVLLLGVRRWRRLAPGQAGPYRVQDLRVVSGPSPFAAGCPGARFDDKTITGHELEPMIAVNPANPRNIVAAWKQDVGSANQTRSDLVASSLDGGKTWTRSTIPGLSVCTGGTADSPSDPWVAAGRDGTVYFSGLAASLSTDPPTTAVVASHSRDGGRSWPVPATVAAPLAGNETDAITASPRRAGHAYLAWANFVFDSSPGPIPWSSRARPTAGARGRLPSWSTSRARSPSTRPPESSCCRTGRCWPCSCASTSSSGSASSTPRARSTRGGRGCRRCWPAPSRSRRPPRRSRHGPPAAGAGVSQRGGRPGRHRLRRLRRQHLGELGGDRRGEVAGRRPHLEQRPAARHQRVRVRARDRRRCARHGRRDLVRPAQRPAGRQPP